MGTAGIIRIHLFMFTCEQFHLDSWLFWHFIVERCGFLRALHGVLGCVDASFAPFTPETALQVVAKLQVPWHADVTDRPVHLLSFICGHFTLI
jgi:hypothetical protein